MTAKKPPLGKLIDFDAEEAAVLENVKYIPIDTYLDLEMAVRFGSLYLNNLRKQHGLKAVTISDTDVRLVEPDIYNADYKSPRGLIVNLAKEGENGGFFDPKTGLCFVRFDPTKDAVDAHTNIKTAYTIVHELSHKGMDGGGIQDYSFHLNEGFADWIAREIMQHVTPKILSDEDYAENRAYIEACAPVQDQDGILYMGKDILIRMPNRQMIGYFRVPQMQLIESIARTNPSKYHDLFYSALCGDSKRARDIIESCYGFTVADKLSKKDIPLRTLVELVR